MMSGHFSFGGTGLIWMIILALLVVVPFWKILPRHGLKSWYAVFAIIPVGAIILLWIIAFKDGNNQNSGGV